MPAATYRRAFRALLVLQAFSGAIMVALAVVTLVGLLNGNGPKTGESFSDRLIGFIVGVAALYLVAVGLAQLLIGSALALLTARAHAWHWRWTIAALETACVLISIWLFRLPGAVLVVFPMLTVIALLLPAGSSLFGPPPAHRAVLNTFQHRWYLFIPLLLLSVAALLGPPVVSAVQSRQIASDGLPVGAVPYEFMQTRITGLLPPRSQVINMSGNAEGGSLRGPADAFVLADVAAMDPPDVVTRWYLDYVASHGWKATGSGPQATQASRCPLGCNVYYVHGRECLFASISSRSSGASLYGPGYTGAAQTLFEIKYQVHSRQSGPWTPQQLDYQGGCLG